MGYSAIVIGATGLVGTALIDQLAESPHIEKIMALTRRPCHYNNAKVHNHVIEFDRIEDFHALFAADLFFSCLGTTRKEAGSLMAQRKVDLDYQYEAARLAAKCGVKHYLLVSSASADVNSGNQYLQMKGELEQRVVDLPFPRISIFRPSLLVGLRKNVRVGEKVGNVVLPLLCLLPGLSRFRPISGSEVAAKMVKVAEEKGGSLHSYTLDELFL
ncbi:MAG: hypothetical protein ACI89U_000712 [Gammaproteobacteria bacterium]|jgi:uncharacterized protein YbjT (DUF2867 family)